MKSALALIVTLCVGAFLPICASAQTDGDPFAYTIAAGFVDGEPDATLTATSGNAFAIVSASATYTVKNTNNNIRQSSTYCFLETYINNGLGSTYFNNTQTSDVRAELDPDESTTYSLLTYGSGNLSIGTYTAYGPCVVSDDKTEDYLNQPITPMVVVVGP